MHKLRLDRPAYRNTAAPSGALLFVFVAACSSATPASSAPDGALSPDTGTVAQCPSPGGPTPGAADTHCVQSDGGMTVQTTDLASCHPDGAAPFGGGNACPYGETMFGTDAYDDDCKYHVTWTSTPVCQGAPVSFTVVLQNAVDRSPAAGANVIAEVFTTSPLDASCDTQSTHPGPNSGASLLETAAGTYSGGIAFDRAGQWTVRLHFREDCADTLPTSPHGHAAFHVTVP